METENFNSSLRAFLKKVGISSQREIERYVDDALRAGRLEGRETLTVSIQLHIEGKETPFVVEDQIRLD